MGQSRRKPLIQHCWIRSVLFIWINLPVMNTIALGPNHTRTSLEVPTSITHSMAPAMTAPTHPLANATPSLTILWTSTSTPHPDQVQQHVQDLTSPEGHWYLVISGHNIGVFPTWYAMCLIVEVLLTTLIFLTSGMKQVLFLLDVQIQCTGT